MSKLFLTVLFAFYFLFQLAVIAIFTGVIVMLLWNWLMPVIFGLELITWFQGWGIAFLCGILFKGSNAPAKTSN